jgi:FdhD protein
MQTHFDTQATLHSSDQRTRQKMALVEEEPLSIRVEGKPYAVVLRTPGDELAHAAGFCLAEGIIDSAEDVANLGTCDTGDTNVVTITLTAERRRRMPDILDRRAFISQTGCGLCGKVLIDDIQSVITPLEAARPEAPERLREALQGLGKLQPLRETSRASHAAAIYDRDLNLLSVAEDVGRHNALDKAIGKLLLSEDLPRAHTLLLSSRISYELVQKAARAGIPLIAAMSRPTALAVRLGTRLNMTLACLNKPDGLLQFCGNPLHAARS